MGPLANFELQIASFEVQLDNHLVSRNSFALNIVIETFYVNVHIGSPETGTVGRTEDKVNDHKFLTIGVI